ncbi:GTP-binding protein [Streptomyces sp. NPDC088915]|uniref:GTP-binding protein n=1 Tax=Streptomyces sp. NPDC088915 TaxID=3365912 RepID=UPI00380EE550
MSAGDRGGEFSYGRVVLEEVAGVDQHPSGTRQVVDAFVRRGEHLRLQVVQGGGGDDGAPGAGTRNLLPVPDEQEVIRPEEVRSLRLPPPPLPTASAAVPPAAASEVSRRAPEPWWAPPRGRATGPHGVMVSTRCPGHLLDCSAGRGAHLVVQPCTEDRRPGYDTALVLVGIAPAPFLADITCVHRAVRVWSGGEHSEPLTPAEIAVRQVEAADALVLAGTSPEDGRQERAAALLRPLNSRAGTVTLDRVVAERPASGRVLTRAQAPARMPGRWEAWREPTASPYAPPAPGRGASTVVWRSRRPLHPERLAGALGEVMSGVLRSRGHLWLASRPGAVVTWRSAGGRPEIREADRWLEAHASPEWAAASPQRRTLACWFWGDHYGERRNEIVLTGTDRDVGRITGALHEALLDHAGLSLGRGSWRRLNDPLLGTTETH